MKSIFSKSSIGGGKKEANGGGKMERRVIPNQAVVSPNAGRVSSFIPTAATFSSHNHNGHAHMNGGHHPGKHHSQTMQHAHNNGYYSNIPGSVTTTVAVARQEQAYSVNTNYQQQQQQSMQHRALSKSYSSSQSNQGGQSHYGNTSLYANNQSSFYGNAANLTNGAIIMNGHHGGENTLMNGQHNHKSEMMGHVQSSYNQEQIHQHQIQIQQSHQKLIFQQQQQQTIRMQQSNNSSNVNVNQQFSFHPAQVSGSNAMDGLPATLVESMRTLFDILDDGKTGKIRLSDIETRWESDSNNGQNGKASGAEPLIKMGVLEYLRKVTPSDGMLTFDRFCSGLRLALLTNGNDNPDSAAAIQNMKSHQDKNQRQANPPQQFFQEQVKNMTNTANNPSKSMQHQGGVHPPSSQFYNNGSSGHNSMPKTSSGIQHQTQGGQSNTIQRFSKIPNFSTSRLPQPNSGSSGGGIPNSGIPISPSNKANTIPLANSNKGQSGPLQSQTLISGTKRYAQNQNSGGDNNTTTTTVALVHPQPPPNPKPTGQVQASYGGMNGTVKGKGFLGRFSSRNSSLDDLQSSPSTGQGQQGNGNNKDRPPSAPILDSEENNNNNSNKPKESQVAISNKQNKGMRERAKSQERDKTITFGHHHHPSRAEEKANFIKSRQRTLSMPQLQLNKLKSKNVSVNFEDSAVSSNDATLTAKQSPSPVETFPKPSNLKNHSLSKLLASGHQYGSSIPAPNSSSSLKLPKEGGKELPPPPPKPPRNGMNGPVTISTTLISGLSQDPPLSNSSLGSGQSSSATISVSASSSSGGGVAAGAKPEIRSVLNSWQKSLTEKKAVKPSLSVTSIGTSSTMNTCETAISVPSSAGQVSSAGGNQSGISVINGAIESGDEQVKMRQPTKSSLKRKETARRHTVQSGIDFNTLKRLKQLEQERDVLQQGLQYLEKANEWYMKQLETSNDKITMLSKGAPTAEYWSENHEERLNLLGCRIAEVNSLLTALMDGSSQLPLHMNLQIPSHLSLRTMTRLKDQNRQLTQEVSDYSHRVTQLENEKAMLLRQLFHQKNVSAASEETVYM